MPLTSNETAAGLLEQYSVYVLLYQFEIGELTQDKNKDWSQLNQQPEIIWSQSSPNSHGFSLTMKQQWASLSKA